MASMFDESNILMQERIEVKKGSFMRATVMVAGVIAGCQNRLDHIERAGFFLFTIFLQYGGLGGVQEA